MGVSHGSRKWGRTCKNSWSGRQRCCGTRRDRVRNSVDLSPSKARPERVARSDMSASGACGACASRARRSAATETLRTRRQRVAMYTYVEGHAVGTFGRYHGTSRSPCAICQMQRSGTRRKRVALRQNASEATHVFQNSKLSVAFGKHLQLYSSRKARTPVPLPNNRIGGLEDVLQAIWYHI